MIFFILLLIHLVVCTDYCIIGAGPSGLQLGYFLQRSEADYVIFESSSSVGSFFATNPRSRLLISTNKVNTGSSNKEFNLRHDWNSLLTHANESLLMRDFSSEYFPSADDYLKYLQSFHTTFGINVRFNTRINSVQRRVCSSDDDATCTGPRFRLWSNDFEMAHDCQVLIVATGLPLANRPKAVQSENVEQYGSYDAKQVAKKATNGRVLILGKGNSAFETAKWLYTKAAHVHIIGRSLLKLAWHTHYLGDVRAINNEILDSYLLKTLDGLAEVNVNSIRFHRSNCTHRIYAIPTHRLSTFIQADRLCIDKQYELKQALPCSNCEVFSFLPKKHRYFDEFGEYGLRKGYGWKPDRSIFESLNNTINDEQFETINVFEKNEKYPKTTEFFESENVKDLYFIGNLAHGKDYKQSSGGFIHGFRYTTRIVYYYLQFKYENNEWPRIAMEQRQSSICENEECRTNLSEVTSALMIERANEASSLYQMFGQICDIVLICENQSVEYLRDISCFTKNRKILQCKNSNVLKWITFSFEYGENFKGEIVFGLNRAAGNPREPQKSNFLHPILRLFRFENQTDVFETELHLSEDFLTDWSHSTFYNLPTKNFISSALSRQ